MIVNGSSSVGVPVGGGDRQFACLAGGNSVTLNADGTVTANTANPNWFAPTSGAAGANYWARTTKTGGNRTTSPADGTWVSLNGGIAYSATGGFSGSLSALIEFSTNSGGTNIVGSSILTIVQ